LLNWHSGAKVMEERLTELESRIAFQEDTIQKLNDVIVQQQHLIEQIVIKQKIMQDQLSAMEPSLLADQERETPPPHY